MKVTRRLERLEVVSAPPGDPPMMEFRVTDAATGEVIQRILTPLGRAGGIPATKTPLAAER
jgi:hypothetical protein